MKPRVHRLSLDFGLAAGLVAALASVYLVENWVAGASDSANAAGSLTPQTGNLIQPGSIYAKRTDPNRGKELRKWGGSRGSEKAAKKGLAWLARHQTDDGSWSNKYLGDSPRSVCELRDPCKGPGETYPMAQTGLALLAFQAGGHFHFNESKHSDRVRRGLNWIVRNQTKVGALHANDDRDTFMYGHGIATFALAEACALAVAADRQPNARYLEAAKKATRYIERQQHEDGGWRYRPNNPSARSDTSVSGWQVLALKTAENAGITIDKTCIRKVGRFFRQCERGRSGRTGYTPERSFTEATTGVGMLVHQFLLNHPDAPLVHRAAGYLAGYAEDRWGNSSERSADYYLWYNCTLSMFQAGGHNWRRWNRVVRNTIISLQETSGCVRGSWSPESEWGGEGGRIYTTALAVLTLEVYYRFTKRKQTTSST